VNVGKVLMVTLGSKGVRYLDDTQELFVPAYEANCIDPVGDRDEWRGVFVVQLINGKKLIDCLIIGNVVANFAVENSGGIDYSLSH
jgi:sugar/nucleoside kinase (ribokinase family)